MISISRKFPETYLKRAFSTAILECIVHRDLKPGNVMLVHDSAVFGGERARVLDFGIAKLMQGMGEGTASGVVMGTPQYMSPEQCAGACGVDDKTDVYSLGVLLYEMVAGRQPFLGESHIQLMGQHAFAPPPPLREFAPRLPKVVEALVHGLLVKDKALRPAMQQVEGELSGLLLRFSGANLSAEPAASSQEETRRYQAARALSSTLGGFLGQTLRPARRRAAHRALFALTSGAVLMLGLALLGRQGRHQTVAAPVVSQPALRIPIATNPSAEERASRLRTLPAKSARSPSVPPEAQPPAKKKDLSVASSDSGHVDAVHGHAELTVQKEESPPSAAKLNPPASKLHSSAASRPNPSTTNKPKQPAESMSTTRRAKTAKDYDD